MIGVSEESEIRTVASPAELHEILSGLVGRLLRVRTIEQKQKGDSYRGIAPYTELVYEDWIAELSSLRLRRTNRYHGRRAQGSPSQHHANLELELKGCPRFALDFSRALVEVFQADSGSWSIVHRGREWAERSVHFEKKENDR